MIRWAGWNWFWPWEKWDPHKVEALTGVNLPYLFGIRDYWPAALFGLTCVILFMVVGVVLMYAWVIWLKGKDFMERWGMPRFMITALLFVTMMSTLVKMLMRHLFNIQYIMQTPWINI